MMSIKKYWKLNTIDHAKAGRLPVYRYLLYCILYRTLYTLCTVEYVYWQYKIVLSAGLHTGILYSYQVLRQVRRIMTLTGTVRGNRVTGTRPDTRYSNCPKTAATTIRRHH